jgi:signal transduction histidine kinase/CheY-like chemotaxis protein
MPVSWLQSVKIRTGALSGIGLDEADRLPRWTIAMFAASFVTLLVAGISAGLIATRSQRVEKVAERTLQVHRLTEHVITMLQLAETSQRGYLLTGDEEFLKPYRTAASELTPEWEKLKQLSQTNGSLDVQLAELSALIDRRLSGLQEAITLLQRGDTERARDPKRLNSGQAQLLEIRERLTRLSDAEEAQMIRFQAEAAELRETLMPLVAISLAATVVLALLVGRAITHYISRLVARTAELEREARLRRETEDTLRQSQKMEAIGQLTGGVAHDFNNLLTVILGNLDTVHRRLSNVAAGQEAAHFATTLLKPIELAIHGSRSAAQLTHRLLAFSRRQALEPTHLDLNRLVAGMSDLLHRTVGESIKVETVLAGGLWPTFADANQVENVLLNLVINARDAMPAGGNLTIETANTYLDETYARRFGDVAPGQYVMLSITDTGTGIPRDMLDRVFEPFFTTKGTGVGSGLGLAMVHGFVKQSHGHVRIYSEVGVGTTVKVYLPRSTETADMPANPVGTEGPALPVPRAQRDETVLVVEDNANVREYAVSVLEDLGYRVIEAADVDGALKAIEDAPPIDLLFTDVVLPGKESGRDLANILKQRFPGLPVLFTTGYTRNAIVHNGRLDAKVHLLNKPYTQQELARKLRELLDAAKASGN